MPYFDRKHKHSDSDAVISEGGTVGARSVTQRHAAKLDEGQRSADHARLDAAWAGVQLARDAHTGLDDEAVQRAAARGIAGSGSQLPHLESIQRSFGEHDISGVRAHTGSEAAEANRAMGAHGYATGNDVAFADSSPSQFLVAHEAAHVVQQRAGVSLKGAVGQAGDSYEQHADAVASRVVAGQSAADLLGPVGSSSGTAVQRDTDPNPKKPGEKAKTVTSNTMRVENGYRHVFANQRAGLTRLGAALKKDESPPKSLIGTIAGGVVGGAIGALLGPVGVWAVEEVESKLAKKAVEKIAGLIKDKAVAFGSEAATKKFSPKGKTDPADDFLQAQTIGLNDAEAHAIDELYARNDELEGVEGGDQAMAALSTQVLKASANAADLQIAQSAGAWARATADNHSDAGAWANDDAGGGREKGAIEITVMYQKGSAIKITGSNWRGVGNETEGVVENNGAVAISELGATLRVTVEGTQWDTAHFEATASGQIILPQKSTHRQALMVAGGLLVDGHESDKDLESGAMGGAQLILYTINGMPVSSLKFGQ